MKKLKKIISEWRAFVVEDILKKVNKEMKEDIEILLESLRDEGIIKE